VGESNVMQVVEEAILGLKSMTVNTKTAMFEECFVLYKKKRYEVSMEFRIRPVHLKVWFTLSKFL
jgi:hypothetical protein